MRNRYLLCLLLSLAMIYLAVGRMDPRSGGAEGLFAISWLAFAFLVFAGNLAAFLFHVKKERKVLGTNTQSAVHKKSKAHGPS